MPATASTPPSAPSAPSRDNQPPAGTRTPPGLVERLTAAIDRFAYSGGTHGPHNAALRVLADPHIADALNAREIMRQLRTHHTWRHWHTDSTAATCSCGAGNCHTATLLWGTP